MKNKIIIALIIILPMLMYGIKQNITKNETGENVKNNVAIAKENIQSKIIVYKFYSPLCKDCIIQGKEIEKIKPNLSKKVIYEEINVSEKTDKNNNLIKNYKIMTVPTIVIVSDTGKIEKKIVNIISGEELIMEIDEILRNK